MLGYCKRILVVDLTAKRISEEQILSDSLELVVGGSGLGVKLMLDKLGDKIASLNPLAPDSPILFLTGPLAGSGLPGTGRMAACAKSPLTNLWGESNVGGNMAAYLKSIGYDGVLITGRADEPVILNISSKGVQLTSAKELWGEDTYTVTDNIWRKQSNSKKRPAVLAIGQAGENLVPYAAIVHNKSHVLGRTGMGAVMGSKLLKAIVLDSKTRDADTPTELFDLRKKLNKKLQDSIIIQALGAFGTLSSLDMGALRGDVPIKNWQLGEWDEMEKINGSAMTDTILVKRKSCLGCPVGCKRVVEVTEGPYKVPRGAGPEYETVTTFGTMCLVDDLGVIAKANELCNRYGMDTISCGATIAFAMDCYEKGLINSEECDHMELTWGNGEAIIKLLKNIAMGKGFGKRLSKGSAALAKELGPEAEKYVTTVKGLEAPMHDPRSAHGVGLAYATGARGACHVSCRTMAVEHGASYYPKIGIDELYEGQTSQGKAEVVVKSQNLGAVQGGAAIICELAAMGFDDQDLCDMLSVVSGENWTMDKIMEAGERIWLLKRIFNLLCGLKPADDNLPQQLLRPLSEGGAAESVPDMELMLKEFYNLRGLSEQGFPREARLNELGLNSYAQLLKQV